MYWVPGCGMGLVEVLSSGDVPARAGVLPWGGVGVRPSGPGVGGVVSAVSYVGGVRTGLTCGRRRDFPDGRMWTGIAQSFTLSNLTTPYGI